MGTSHQRHAKAGNLNISKDDVEVLEMHRVGEQKRLDQMRGQSERNRLGQFATPTVLAREIVQYIKFLWEESGEAIRFLDPAIGAGSFYSALLHEFPHEKIQQASGVEIDTAFADLCRLLWGKTGLNVTNADFTRLDPPARKFNLILTNPPYVRHHHLSRDDKVRLCREISSIIEDRTNGLSGLYCYFLLLSHKWLAEDGLSVWLIPSEFMDVNYGTILKKYLASKVTLLHVHRYNPEHMRFEDALVSSVVVVFRNAPPTHNSMAKFSFGGCLEKPELTRSIHVSELDPEKKWSGLHLHVKKGKVSDKRNIALSSLFTVKRGIATGANSFFIMPLSKAYSLGIDERFFKPILPGPRFLPFSVIDADERGYPVIDNQAVIIDSDLPEDLLREECAPLWAYLQTGKEKGIHQTYLTRKRMPWYRQEQREPSPFLCTYMGRTGAAGKSPFRILWNKSRAVTTNVYLLMYPIGPLKKALNENAGLYEAVFNLLREINSNDFMKEGRVYGGGLYKIEPMELGCISVNHIVDALDLRIQDHPLQQSFF